MEEILLLVFFISYFYGTNLIFEKEITRFAPRERIESIKEKYGSELNKWIVRKRREIPDRELYKSSVILKNLSLVKKETPLSADYIYESLMNNSEFLKEMYGEMLILYRGGKDEEAFKVPARVIGTKAAKNFALILSKLDKLNPAELIEQMNIFQTSMLERRMTYAVKKAQRNSIIISALSAASVFALLINFVVVVVFMKSFSMMTQMFA